MSTTDWILVAAAVVLLALVVWWMVTRQRRERLRDRFGGEYERAVEDHGSTRQAERDLLARARRHDELQIRPLPPERVDRYVDAWRTTQTRFVDAPEATLAEADALVQEVMAERGYPVGDFEQRTADLSVEHADVLDHYRRAHDVALASADGGASTEDLRQGMVHYRALFAALLEGGADEAHDDMRRHA